MRCTRQERSGPWAAASMLRETGEPKLKAIAERECDPAMSDGTVVDGRASKCYPLRHGIRQGFDRSDDIWGAATSIGVVLLASRWRPACSDGDAVV